MNDLEAIREILSTYSRKSKDKIKRLKTEEEAVTLLQEALYEIGVVFKQIGEEYSMQIANSDSTLICFNIQDFGEAYNAMENYLYQLNEMQAEWERSEE